MLVNVKDAAELLGVSSDLVRSEIEAGRLSAFKVGRLVRIRRSDIENYLAGNRVVPRPSHANDNRKQAPGHRDAVKKLHGFLGGSRK